MIVLTRTLCHFFSHFYTGNFHPFFRFVPPHLSRQDHLPDEDAAPASSNGQWPPFDRFDTFPDEHLPCLEHLPGGDF